MTDSNTEKWVWAELLAFDVNQTDLGVRAYVETLGFAPAAICLLIASPDFVLQHAGIEVDEELPPDFCSRNGQAGNENRRRQVWTRFQLRELIARLQVAGSEVYASLFTDYLQDKFHREWLCDHPDGKIVLTSRGRCDALFVLNRLNDGSLLQDFFAAQLTKACLDYGFDGWHGADGYGPGVAPLYEADCSDDMIQQFMEWGQGDLPAAVTQPSDDRPEKLQVRMDWIWRNRRMEWMEFYCDRWADFWSVICRSLHSVGKKAVINSAWTRDPFEAKYRYGIDYRKIAEAGIDAIVVEAVAGSIMLGTSDREYHFDFLATLLLMKACVPDTKLIFLHPIKDVNENWDLLRHAPAMLEREAYALANAFYTDDEGKLVRCADGFLGCLADGISRQEWDWLHEVWDLAFEAPPLHTFGATAVWSGQAFARHLGAFPQQRDWPAHRLIYQLMQNGAPIQAAVDIGSINQAQGLLLVPNADLLSEQEQQSVIACGRPFLAFGYNLGAWPEIGILLSDNMSLRPLQCRAYGVDGFTGFDSSLTDNSLAQYEFPSDVLGLADPIGFREELYFRPVTVGFLTRCVRLIQTVSGAFNFEGSTLDDKISLTVTEPAPQVCRVAVKSTDHFYNRPRIDIGRRIELVKVRSRFPVTDMEYEGSVLNFIVPPRGIVVVDVRVAPASD